MSDPPYDVAVVGAGIVGAACAFWAAEAGLRVFGCDRGPLAGGSTGAGMGHLVALGRPPELLALTKYSRDLWMSLGPRLPPAVGLRPTGTLWLAADEAGMSEVGRLASELAAQGVHSERVDSEHLHRLEPILRSDLPGGLLVPGDGLLDPVAATQFLWGAAVARGGRLETGRTVAALADGRVDFADRTSVRAGHVINATGLAAPTLSEGVRVVARRGHLLRLRRPSIPVQRPLLEIGYSASVESPDAVSVAFNAQPQTDGSLLLGATREWGRTDLAPDPEILRRLRERASGFAPQIADLPTVGARTGVRPATVDQLPWIGPVPSSDRCWVAAGHEGLGITASLGTGRLLVDLILGRSPEIPMRAYAVTPERISGAAARLATEVR